MRYVPSRSDRTEDYPVLLEPFQIRVLRCERRFDFGILQNTSLLGIHHQYLARAQTSLLSNLRGIESHYAGLGGDDHGLAFGDQVSCRTQAVSVEQHEREWDEIFDGIHDVVDACAFQDGHIDYDELDAFFTVNKKLADKYGMQCWTNAESFDRDMPIKFLPIKFDKLRMKLEAAKRAGYDKAITFEFSHFMSPQSAYLQAGHLYDRYKEYFNIR